MFNEEIDSSAGKLGKLLPIRIIGDYRTVIELNCYVLI